MKLRIVAPAGAGLGGVAGGGGLVLRPRAPATHRDSGRGNGFPKDKISSSSFIKT